MKFRSLILVIATSPLWAAGPDSAASIPTSGYRSVFDDYQALRDEAMRDWRQVNDEMGRRRGHMGHLDGENPAPANTHRHPEAAAETTPDDRR